MNIYTEKEIQQFPFTNLIHSTPQSYHTHSFWEITIVLTGSSINIMHDNPRKTLFRGDAIILRPSDCHYIRPLTKATEYTHRDIYIPIEKFKNICIKKFTHTARLSFERGRTFKLEQPF